MVPGPERSPDGLRRSAGSPDRLRTASAVLRLIGSGELTTHERRTLAALIVVVGELDHASLNPALGATFDRSVEALTDLDRVTR